MKAHLRNTRLSQKKANLIAAMVRGERVDSALGLLGRMPKKGATLLSKLIASAVANAEHNAGQRKNDLFIKTIVVNKARGMRRFIPIARGRARAIEKAASHVSVELGVIVPEGDEEQEKVNTSKKAESTKKEGTTASKSQAKDKKATKMGDADIEYSAAKPQDSFHKDSGTTVHDDDAHTTESPSDHGSSQFQQHRQGSRGS